MSVSDVAATRTSISESAPELIAGLAVIVLTILGLAKVFPVFLVAIATIVFGTGLLLFGRSVVGEVARVFPQRDDAEAMAGPALSGLPIVFLAGVSGIVLGILALLGISALDLVAIAVIVFGGALILSSSMRMRVRLLSRASANIDRTLARIAEDAASDSVGMQTLSGLAAVVLGILALADFAPATLVLVALLQLGCFVALSSTTLSSGLMRAFTAS